MSSKTINIGLRLVIDAGPALAAGPGYHHAQLDQANFVIPSLFSKQRELDSSKQRWEDPFSVFGKDAKTIAQKISEDPMGDTIKEALKDCWEKIFERFDETPLHLRDEFIFHHTSTGAADGHRACFAGSVPVKDAGKLFETEAILRHMLQSFPQGAEIVEPKCMEKVKQAADKAEFIKANAVEIKAATDKYLAEGGSLTSCGALLGSTNVVAVRGVTVAEIADRVVQTMVVATMNPHGLDGVNLWMAAYDPLRPHSVIFSNALEGKHKLTYVMDLINNTLGQRLMTTTWATVPLSIEAAAAGIPLEKHIAERAAAASGDHRASTIARSRFVFAGMDRVAFIPATIRDYLGSNLDISKGLSIVLNAYEDGPVADRLRSLADDVPASTIRDLRLKIEDKASGFWAAPRSPADPTLFMAFGTNSSLPSALEIAARTAVRNPAEQLLDSRTVSKIRADLSEMINKPTISALFKENPSGSTKLMEQMRLNTAWTLAVEDYLLREITPDLEVAVHSSLKQELDSSSEWQGLHESLFEKAVLEAVRETVCSPLLAPDGFVEQCAVLDMSDVWREVVAPTSTTAEMSGAMELGERLKEIVMMKGEAEREVRSLREEMGRLERDGKEFMEGEKYDKEFREVEERYAKEVREVEEKLFEEERKVEELERKEKGMEEVRKEVEGGIEGLEKMEKSVREMEKSVREMEREPRRILEHAHGK